MRRDLNCARISTDAETGVVRLSCGMKNVGGAPVTLTRANWRFTLAERQYSLLYSGGRMVARKPQRLAQLRRGRNGENRCDNKAHLRIGASERLCVELKPGAG